MTTEYGRRWSMPEAQLIVTDMLFPILHSYIDQFCIIGFFRGGKDERGVGGSILRLVFADCLEYTSGAIHWRSDVNGNVEERKGLLEKSPKSPVSMFSMQMQYCLDAHQNRTPQPVNHAHIC